LKKALRFSERVTGAPFPLGWNWIAGRADHDSPTLSLARPGSVNDNARPFSGKLGLG
jgi:hypothetical protein